MTASDRPKSLLHDVVSPVTFHLCQLGQRQPVSQTQLQQHRLLVTLLRVEDLMVLDGQTTLGQPAPVRGGMLDIPPPRPVHVGVGSRTNPPPVTSQPVRHVVTTPMVMTVAGPGPVRHLVVDVPCLGEGLLGDEVLVGEVVLVSHR